MKSKKLLVAFLIMLSLVLTTGTFAYWATEVEGIQETAINSITIGSAKSVETKIDLNNIDSPYGYLVPKNQVNNSKEKNSVGEMNFTFDLKWLEDNDVSQLTGSEHTGYIRTEVSYEIYNDDELLSFVEYNNIYSLLHISPVETNDYSLVLNSDTANSISYTVTMDEPSNKTEYDLIKNSTIIVYFNFTIDTHLFNPYGTNLLEVVSYVENEIDTYYEENGSYPRSWGDYAYTDLGLDIDDFEDPMYNFEIVPRGSRINLRLEDGYSLSIELIDGTVIDMNYWYNWNLIYDTATDTFYFRSVSEDSMIDISTLVVSEIE